MPAVRGAFLRQRPQVLRQRWRGQDRRNRFASGFVTVGAAVPVAAEAEHADVHLAAAAHRRHVGRHAPSIERAALVGERALLIERQVACKVVRAGSKRGERTS